MECAFYLKRSLELRGSTKLNLAPLCRNWPISFFIHVNKNISQIQTLLLPVISALLSSIHIH